MVSAFGFDPNYVCSTHAAPANKIKIKRHIQQIIKSNQQLIDRAKTCLERKKKLWIFMEQ